MNLPRAFSTITAVALGCIVLPAPSTHAARPPDHALKVGPGITMLDLGEDDKPTTGATILNPVMSADGEHVAYGFDVGDAREYGLIWRDLKSGRTIRRNWSNFYPYALAISASGRYVAYAAAGKITSSGAMTGMNVWLWDTRTGKRTIVSRLPDGVPAREGFTEGVGISANGRWVVFASSSKLLAPQGAIEDPGNEESDSYIYLYDRVTKKVTALPWSASFPQPTPFRYPVISAEGNVVAFKDGLEPPMVWYPGSGVVRPVPLAAETGAGDGAGLALSADGGELATSAFGVNVVALGESAETDRLLWSEPRDESTTGSVALSADGTKLAFIGGSPTLAQTVEHVWLASIPGGPAWGLRPAPTRLSLPAAPRPVGGLALNTVSMTRDGDAVAAVMCSRGYKSWDQCSSRMDLFRWQTGF